MGVKNNNNKQNLQLQSAAHSKITNCYSVGRRIWNANDQEAIRDIKDLADVCSSCFYCGGDRSTNSRETDNETQLPYSAFHRIVMCLIKSILTVQSLMFHVLKIITPHSALTLMTAIYTSDFTYRKCMKWRSTPSVSTHRLTFRWPSLQLGTGHTLLKGKEHLRFLCCLS